LKKNSFKEIAKINGKLENLSVNEGGEAKFILNYTGGNPKPSFKWFKDEEEIIVTEETVYEFIETEETVQFIIKTVSPSNTGSYFVQLCNEAGQISSNKAQLVVNSKYFFLIFEENFYIDFFF
jgi:hypothetical protein